MGRYLYTIKDKQTGEVLFAGGEGDSARFLNCDPVYMSNITRRGTMAGKRIFYGNKEITRQWVDAIVECQMCGITIENGRPNQKYCRACAKKRKNSHISSGISMQCLQEDGILIHIQQKQRQMQEHCRGCIYFGGENYMNASCNYLFIVGHSRGCPPGAGCTVRKEKQK